MTWLEHDPPRDSQSGRPTLGGEARASVASEAEPRGRQ